MSILRIYCSLRDPPQRCLWALVNEGVKPVSGEGELARLPQSAERVQLVIPAAEVMITRARLPQSAKRRAGSVLAYAVEEKVVDDPDANQVSWLGSVADSDVLAIVDRKGLKRWLDALGDAGIRGYEVHCETLLLPWTRGEWSLAWNGREGFVRTGEFEGAATDCGDHEFPPLSLRMMLDEAKSRGAAPSLIVVYLNAHDIETNAALEIEAWQRALGVAMRVAGSWDWREAPSDAGISLARDHQRWHLPPDTLKRLRPAAWLVGVAVVIHTLALVADWTRLAAEQHSLRVQMESRFRSVFSDAVAVADPALQMRRKLAEARHAVGRADDGDFLPMIGKIGNALKELPPGSLRIASYESGRMTLELTVIDEAGLRRLVTRLDQSGLRVDRSAGTSAVSARPGSATVILTVRPS